MRLYPELKISIGLIIAFSLVVAGGSFAYINSTRAVSYGKSVNKGLELLAALESLLQVTKTNQKAALVYATTGDAIALKKFEESIKTVEPHLQYIKGEAATDNRRYVLITSLETQIRAFNNQISTIVVERKKTGKNLTLAENFRQVLDNKYELIRGRVFFIESEEQELLKRKMALYERESQNLFKTYALLAGMVAIFFLALIFTLVRYIRSTREAVEAERRIADTIFKFAPIGILILNEKLEVKSSNPMFSGYLQGADWEGKRVLDLIPDLPTEVVDYLDMFTDHWKGLETAKEFTEARIFEDRYFNLVLWPMLSAGEEKGIIMLFLDTTAKVNLDKQKQLLLNTFTHDLKNPLIGNQYLLKAIQEGDEKLDSEQKEMIANINQGTEDVLRMVTNILSIAKLEDHSKALNITEFNGSSLIDEAIEELRNICVSKNIEIEKDCSAGKFPLHSDRNMLKHLLINLLANAIKFSDEGEKVTVTLAKESGIALFKVSDNGPGIQEIDMRNLFSRTWQGELGRAVPGGTGIGLYLCAQIVQALKGEIRCESGSARGTTFIVKIPERLEVVKAE